MRSRKILVIHNLTKSFWLPFLALNLLLPLIALADGPAPGTPSLSTEPPSETRMDAAATAATTSVVSPPVHADTEFHAPPADRIIASPGSETHRPPTTHRAGDEINPDVTLAELSGSGSLIRGGFEAVTTPANSVNFTSMNLEGMIFRECAGKLKAVVYNGPALSPTGTKDSAAVGIRIVDNHGLARACMNDYKDQKCNINVCVSLKSLGFGMRTDQIGAKEVKYCYYTEGSVPTCESFATPLRHWSQAELRAQSERQRAEAEHARELARAKAEEDSLRQRRNLIKLISHCTKSQEQLDSARSLIEVLEGQGEEEGVIARLRKQLDKGDLDLMKKEVNTVALDDLDDVKQHLQDFAEAHPEKVLDVARMYHDLAIRKVKHRGVTQADFYEADDLITEAEKLDGLKQDAKDTLAGYHQDISIGKLQAMTQNGITDPSTFWPTWMNTMWNIENRVNDTCTADMSGGMDLSGGAAGGMPGSLGGNQSCGIARNRLNALSSIPQSAQAAQARRYAFMQQVQQQISSASGQYNPSMSLNNGLVNNMGQGGMPGQGPYGANGAYGSNVNMQTMPGVNGATSTGFYR